MTGFFVLLAALAAGPSTTNNDDTCDIATLPAATLLLPHFEVETGARSVDTLFTVTNVSNLPQIAHVTLWSDWSYPVLTFNLFLTGYDVQSISLFDVIVNGIVAPPAGTSSTVLAGPLSAANSANANLSIANCAGLPGRLLAPVRAAVQAALVNGLYDANGFDSGCGARAQVGSPAVTHPTQTTAIGYVTIDVTSTCSPTMPTNPDYFTKEILFDNVLIGDYAAIDTRPGANFAGGNPLVHIRAIPEGGPAGVTPPPDPPTNLPYTFYARYVNGVSPHIDRRQPLPSTFAARYISGGPTGFNTDMKIWREGVTGPATCTNASSNSNLPIGVANPLVSDIVRFDEHENPSTFAIGFTAEPTPNIFAGIPATSRFSTASAIFPPANSPAFDAAGWLYINLDSSKSDQTINRTAHPQFPSRRASQNWVVLSMTAGGSSAGLFATELDAVPLGNGCTPPTGQSAAYGGPVTIGPAKNTNP